MKNEIVKKKFLNWTRISLWIFYALLIATWILGFVRKENQWIAFAASVVFLPFIDLAIKRINPKDDKTDILRVPFKEFMMPWVAFWGLSSIALTYWQTQTKDEYQKRQLEKNYNVLIKSLDSKIDSTRINAISSLYKIANENRDDYLYNVCDVFCSKIRNITSSSSYKKDNDRSPSGDIQLIIDMLFKQKKDGLIFDRLMKNFSGAYLYGADFGNATINKVDLRNATLSKANFVSAKLQNTDFREAILNENVNFENAVLDTVNFRYNTLTDVTFRKSTLRHVIFLTTKLTNVNFENAYFNVANFNSSTMMDVSFIGADVTSVSFRNNSFKKVKFSNANFYNVDFWTKVKTSKEDVDFRGTMFADDDIEKITSQNFTTRKSNLENTE